MYVDDYPIILSPWLVLIIPLACAYLIWRGKVEIITAIFLSQLQWFRGTLIGPISLTWILVFTMLASVLVTKHWRRLFRSNVLLFWLLAWSFWLVLVFVLMPAPLSRPLLRNLFAYIMIPAVTMQIISSDGGRIRTFIIVYILTSLFGGSYTLYNALNFFSLGFNPAAIWNNLSVLRFLGVINYHAVASGFLTGLCLTLSLLALDLRWIVRAGVLLVSVFFVVLIFLSGSRASMVGSLAFLAGLIVDTVRQRKNSILIGTLITLLAFGGIALAFYIYYPNILRVTGSLEDMFTIESRLYFWENYYQRYSGEMLFGGGPRNYNISHNLFIEAMLVSGIPGVMFLVVYLGFGFRNVILLFKKTEKAGNLVILSSGFIFVFLAFVIQAQFLGGLLGAFPLFWSCFALEAMCKLTTQPNRTMPLMHTHLPPAHGTSKIRQTT